MQQLVCLAVLMLQQALLHLRLIIIYTEVPLPWLGKEHELYVTFAITEITQN